MQLDPYQVPTPDTRDPLQRALERLELCQYAVQETHYELETPYDPEHKADILLATESLAIEVIDLLDTVRRMVWGRDHEHSPEEDYED
jgi:hypothetical protein